MFSLHAIWPSVSAYGQPSTWQMCLHRPSIDSYNMIIYMPRSRVPDLTLSVEAVLLEQ